MLQTSWESVEKLLNSLISRLDSVRSCLENEINKEVSNLKTYFEGCKVHDTKLIVKVKEELNESIDVLNKSTMPKNYIIKEQFFRDQKPLKFFENQLQELSKAISELNNQKFTAEVIQNFKTNRLQQLNQNVDKVIKKLCKCEVNEWKRLSNKAAKPLSSKHLENIRNLYVGIVGILRHFYHAKTEIQKLDLLKTKSYHKEWAKSIALLLEVARKIDDQLYFLVLKIIADLTKELNSLF